MTIDWSKAPEWAVGHALHALVGEVHEVWVGEDKYQRLDQPKSFPYGGGEGSARHNPRRYQFRFEQPRPAAWTGEGSPPAGTVCGLLFKGVDQGEVTVLFMSQEIGVFENHTFGHEQCGDLINYQFYQTQAPEQVTRMILREEFEAAYVEDMVRIMGEGIRKQAVDNTRFLMQNGDFQDPALRLALWAWQASRESLVIELPSIGPAPEAPEDAFDDSYLDAHHAGIRMRNRCFLAIEAAGVKVKP